jgi:hypothetical protein
VPAEAERLRHRIRGRDRWFLGVIAAGVVAATVLAVALTRDSDPGRASCVSITRPGFTGAATYRACGSRAPALCRMYAREDAKFAADCRRKGFLRRD